MTGLIFVRFSKARAKILYANKAVIASHNGAATLMVRIANGRMNVLTDVRIQLNVLMNETSHEGRSSYNVHELRLVRATVPAFPLALTLLHPLDKTSALAGLDAAGMEAASMRIFLSVEARDPALAATVHDLKTYGWADIEFGMRYVDLVSIDEDGRPVADLTKISRIEPDLGPSTDSRLGL
jgi:inward rectifier potassium channel